MDKKGKIELLVVISAILLVSMFLIISALSETNVGTYDTSTKTMSIKDGSNMEVASITLNSPQVFRVIDRGPNVEQRVAEFTIDNKGSSQDISSSLEKIDFYDVNDGLQKFDRDFTYKYKNSLGFETVNDYEIVCVDGGKSENGTTLQNCSQVLTGTHQREVFGWVNLNALGEIPSGKTTIGIFTDVLPNEKVEWIPTMFGVEIDEWAEWTESLNVDLTTFITFNASSGNDTAVDAVGNVTIANNGSVAGFPGIIGNSFNFSKSNLALGTFADFNFTGLDVFSVSAWVYVNNLTAPDINQKVLSRDPGPGAPQQYNVGIRSSKQSMELNGAPVSFNTTLTTNTWYHLVWILDLDFVTAYIDGVLNGNVTRVSINIVSDDFALIGFRRYPTAPDWLNGSVDELGIWERALTSSEVSDLYNGGSGITYTTNFTSSPWNITFNLTSADTGEQIITSGPQSDFDISCDNGFNVTNVDNPYDTTNFSDGTTECTFFDLKDDNDFEYFTKVQNITADSNKTVEIPMSRSFSLTQEEHDWLQAVHNCVINGNGCAP